jgi:hypothetical protein
MAASPSPARPAAVGPDRGERSGTVALARRALEGFGSHTMYDHAAG